MKKYLILYAVILTALLAYTWRYYRRENQRLTQNQTALTTELQHYRTRAGSEAASAQVLRLRCSEFEELRAADARRIKELGIKLRRVEAAATTATRTSLEISTPLHDTLVVKPTSILPNKPITLTTDTLHRFLWRDAWVTIEGLIDRDSMACRIASIDTLRQVIHRIPRRFLFFRWGTKALRQEIISSNPHTQIVFSEYVKIEKRGK